MTISKLDQLLLKHNNEVTLDLKCDRSNNSFYTVGFTTYPSFMRGMKALVAFGELGWVQGIHPVDRQLDIFSPKQINLQEFREAIVEKLVEAGFKFKPKPQSKPDLNTKDSFSGFTSYLDNSNSKFPHLTSSPRFIHIDSLKDLFDEDFK